MTDEVVNQTQAQAASQPQYHNKAGMIMAIIVAVIIAGVAGYFSFIGINAEYQNWKYQSEFKVANDTLYTIAGYQAQTGQFYIINQTKSVDMISAEQVCYIYQAALQQQRGVTQ